jgi:hypothetical protein
MGGGADGLVVIDLLTGYLYNEAIVFCVSPASCLCLPGRRRLCKGWQNSCVDAHA